MTEIENGIEQLVASHLELRNDKLERQIRGGGKREGARRIDVCPEQWQRGVAVLVGGGLRTVAGVHKKWPKRGRNGEIAWTAIPRHNRDTRDRVPCHVLRMHSDQTGG